MVAGPRGASCEEARFWVSVACMAGHMNHPWSVLEPMSEEEFSRAFVEQKDQQGWGSGLKWPIALDSMGALGSERCCSLSPLFPEISLCLSRAMAVRLLSGDCDISRCVGLMTLVASGPLLM